MSVVSLDKKSLDILKNGGVFVPSPLALADRTEVNELYQRLLTLYYIRSGAQSVIPGAHTGEFSLNNLAIYKNWLSLVKEMTDQYGKNMISIAAISGPNYMRQAEIAAENNYKMVLIAPTAFSGKKPEDVVLLLKEVASIIPLFAFELQRVIAGSYEFTDELWDEIFKITYGAKGASFDTYRSLRMLKAAAMSSRRDKLILLTGNDDRIVNDLFGEFSFNRGQERTSIQYSGGLLGHFATDTHAAVQWVNCILEKRKTGKWKFALSEEELSHAVNRCNMVIFDALGNFQNSVWGIKYRLTSLGLLPEPICNAEQGRPGQAEAIDNTYNEYPEICDNTFVRENIEWMKREVGLIKK